MDTKRLQYGDYKVVGTIGRPGGDSNMTVFKAQHQGSDAMFVLRILTVSGTEMDAIIDECESVLSEIQSWNIPHSVQIVDHGHTADQLYIVYDLMLGGTLKDRMGRDGITLKEDDAPPMQLPSLGEVLDLSERICDAVDAMHTHGIVHGQLEPRSIMFDASGKAYLGDIGLSRLTKIVFRLENTHSFSVSKYTPPEIWDGQKPTPSTDQYAFACILYELLTGEPPFDSSSIFALMNAHTNDVVSPPHYIRKDLPPDLAMVFWQALAKPVDKRYSSMLSFYTDLERAIGSELGEPTSFFTKPFELDS